MSDVKDNEFDGNAVERGKDLRPTLGRTGEDSPRLNGSNFAVWNARVRAALVDQGLLGFIDQKDYDGDSDSSVVDSDDEDPDLLKPSHPPSSTRSEDLLSDTGTLPFASCPDENANASDAAAQPKADGSSSEASSDSSSSNSSEAMETDSKSLQPSAKPHPSLPVIRNFAEPKTDKERRRAQLRAQAKKVRAKLRAAKKRGARKPSSHERRRRERETRSFLISTIDDSHVLPLRGCTSAYAIYLKLRDRYESSTAHGDPYYTNHYLMTIKYEEGTDRMGFFLTFERALKAVAEATGIVMTGEHKSLYLYHAMPSTWKPDLAIRKGSKKFIPYTDLKNNIERKAPDDYAKRKHVIEKGNLESTATASETALQVISNAPHGRDDPPHRAQGCSYCQRANHVIRDCRALQKHLRTGTVKEGNVLPANFAIIERKPRDDHNLFLAKQQRTHRSDDRQRPAPRNASGFKSPEIYDRFENPVNFDDLQRKFSSRDREVRFSAYATVIVPDISHSATSTDSHDPTWTVDSGCTRHAAYQESWFKEIRPYAGAIMVGGKQQLPIRGIGDVVFEVIDTAGTKPHLEFRDVLYVPDMKFNLLAIAQVLKMGVRLVISCMRCTFFVGKDYKIHVAFAANMDLFRLTTKTPPKTPSSALVASAPTEDKPANALVVQPNMGPNVLLRYKRLGHTNFRVMQRHV